MSTIDQQTSPGTADSKNHVVPVQGDGLRPYPFTWDDQCQDPDQHGLPVNCPICGSAMLCYIKVKGGRAVIWHSHSLGMEDGMEDGMEYHNVVFTTRGNWEVNKRIQRPDGKQEPAVRIRRSYWLTRLNQDGSSRQNQTEQEVNK